MSKKIYYKNKLLAILINKKNLYKQKRINFFTEDKLPLQLASMKHPAGHKILPHKHNKFLRKIYSTSEVLFVLKGLIKVNFYNTKKNIFKNLILKAGEIIIFFEGAHGFEIKKNSHFIEVKQGPYLKKMDKKLF
jgi:hypothetical protein